MGQILKCTYCGNGILKDDFICPNCKKKNNIRLANDLSLCDDYDIYKLGTFRDKLNNAISIFDYQGIYEYSTEILGILPTDFLASYYFAYASKVYYDDSFYIDFLTALDFTYATDKDKIEVLKHLILTCSTNYNTFVIDYIKKISNDPELTNHFLEALTRETMKKEQYTRDDEKKDCFILYADNDKDLAFDALELFEDEQLKCFIAPRNIGHNPRNKYDDIAYGIKNSTCFVIIGSKDFAKSDECVRATLFAQRMNKNLVYFKTDDTSIHDFIDNGTHVDIVEASIDKYGKLEQLLMSTLLASTFNDETKKDLESELESIRKRDFERDEEYRREQQERIGKMEDELAKINQEKESILADQEYTQSLKKCLQFIALDDLTTAKAFIVSCERNYPNHICTTIANLAFLLRKIYQPNSPVDAILSQIKELNSKIVTDYEFITDDETAIYIMLKDDDVYALLINLFYTLGDESRLDYIKNLIKYENLTSESMFLAMVDFLLAESYFRIAYHLILDMKFECKEEVLTKVLTNFKDGDAKVDLVEVLLKQDAYGIGNSSDIENYLKNSVDKISTKVSVVLLANKKGILINNEHLIRYVLFEANDTKYIDPVINLMDLGNLAYDEFILILDYAITQKCKSDILGIKICRALQEKKVGFEIDYKVVNEFLRKPYFSLKSKVEMMECICKFTITKKSYDNILNYYLCFNQSKVSERIKILEVLFNHVKDIPITVLERYVISSNYDGDNKPLVVQMLLDLNMNPLYFSQILANYLMKNNDTEDVMKRVVLQLCNRKLTLGAEEFVNYIKNQRLDGNVIRILIENGQVVKTDCLGDYLERVSDSYPFDELIFNSLFNKKIKLSGMALANYTIFGTDENKFDNFIMFAKNAQENIKKINISIAFGQDYLNCNLAQAYLLKSNDDDKLSERILLSLLESNININEDIKIGANSIKFKKYIQNTTGFIDTHREKLCKIAGL